MSMRGRWGNPLPFFYANYTSDNLPKTPVYGYVRKNQPFLIIFNYTIE
jgi:hypothetical protein